MRIRNTTAPRVFRGLSAFYPVAGHRQPPRPKKYTHPGPRGPLHATPASGTPQAARRRPCLKATQTLTPPQSSQQARPPPPTPRTQAPAQQVTVERPGVMRPDQKTGTRSQASARGSRRPRGPRRARETPAARPRPPPSASCRQGPRTPTTCGTGCPPSLRGCSASRRYSGAGIRRRHLLSDLPALATDTAATGETCPVPTSR